MFSIDDLFSVCDELAPISLSKKMIEIGEYDNSGIIINNHKEVKSVLFSLDLSNEVVKKAKSLKCDTIVTHHPAIYYPIKTLEVENTISSPVLLALHNKMNVISMHLNLDVADNGIDKNLAEGLGAKKFKILDYLDESHGYGREFPVENVKLNDYVKQIKKTFKTTKAISYGKNEEVKIVASFCGGGSSHAEKSVLEKITNADTIVTSDMPHHTIKYIVESGKKIIIIPHYVAENYGFERYYADCKRKINGLAKVFYFEDKRFF